MPAAPQRRIRAIKLTTYQYVGQTRLGAALGDWIVDVSRAHALAAGADGDCAALRRATAEVPPDMIGLLQGGRSAMDVARHAVDSVSRGALGEDRQALMDRAILVPASAARLLAPVPRPPKLMAVWVNYFKHGDEFNQKPPEQAPLFFTKQPTAVIGPGAEIVLPAISKQVDYEAELAVVIGKQGKRIPAAEADDYIAGYTIMNDVSARDFSLKNLIGVVGPSMIQKSFDTFAPMGPWVVTSDEIGDPQDLDVKLDIDGEVLQNSNTKYMIHKIRSLIEYISRIMTLEPGDVITTGTPEGVGFARTPPRWIQPGETITIAIEKIGVLKNKAVAE